VGEYVGKKFGKRWYFLTSDYAYGWQMTDGFRRKGKEFKVTDVGETKHPLGTSDYSSYIPRILAAKPDVLFLDNFGKDQINSAKQATAFGLKKKMQIVCPVLLMSSRMGGGPEAFDGIIGGASYYWELNHPTSKNLSRPSKGQRAGRLLIMPAMPTAGSKSFSSRQSAGSLDALKIASHRADLWQLQGQTMVVACITSHSRSLYHQI
jgi:branched-chain amino acid transport system substrate-binding protein